MKTSGESESEKIYHRAEALVGLAWFCFIGGIICVLVATLAVAQDNVLSPFWIAVLFWTGGSLASSALLFFVVGQLLHIRAALYSINETMIEQHRA